MFRRLRFIVEENKTDVLILKVMIKNLCHCFCTKTQYSFTLDYRGVGEKVCKGEGVAVERGLNKWNQGKVIEIS